MNVTLPDEYNVSIHGVPQYPMCFLVLLNAGASQTNVY